MRTVIAARWVGAVLAGMAMLPASAGAQAVAVAAGDIACAPTAAGFDGGLGTFGANPRCHQKYTSDLFAALDPTVVLPLGDTQYGAASYDDYLASYAREDADGVPISWGRAKAISRPIPGNHEYANQDAGGAFTGAQGYFDYFNGVGVGSGPAGDRDKGYYSFDVDAGTRPDGSRVTWHLVAINSQCAAESGMAAATGWLGGCAEGSPQEQWLRQDLAAASVAGVDCTLAYFHHPRFSAAGAGDNAVMAPIWQALYDYDADLVLSGHHHDYQRFAALDPSGAPEPGRGIRQFVVGTGGRALGTDAPNRQTEAFDNTTFGVLALTLGDGTYAWQFVPDGRSGTFTDSGQDACVAAHVTVTAGPEGLVAGSSPRFEFAASRSGASFACRIDDAAWHPCSSPMTYTGIPDGPHVFSVRAVDAAGNPVTVPATRAFALDATPPALSVAAPTDGSLLAGTVTLAAGATDASGVSRLDWYVDGALVGSSTAAPWTLAWNTAGVPDGRHTLRVSAVDALGNAASSAPILVTVRNAPPRQARAAALRAAVGVVAGRSLRGFLARGLRLRVRCSRPCRVDARVRVSIRTAKRLSLPAQLARKVDRRLRSRRAALAVRPSAAARRRLGRVRAVTVIVRLTLRDAAGDRRTVRRTVRLR